MKKTTVRGHERVGTDGVREHTRTLADVSMGKQEGNFSGIKKSNPYANKKLNTPYPPTKPNTIRAYHSIRFHDRIPQILKEGILLKKLNSQEGGFWVTTGPDDYNVKRYLLVFDLNKNNLEQVNDNQIIVRRDVSPSEITGFVPVYMVGNTAYRIDKLIELKSKYGQKVDDMIIKTSPDAETIIEDMNK